jgi:hypothetical protein
MKSLLALVVFAAVLLLVRGDFDTARTNDTTIIIIIIISIIFVVHKEEKISFFLTVFFPFP